MGAYRNYSLTSHCVVSFAVAFFRCARALRAQAWGIQNRIEDLGTRRWQTKPVEDRILTVPTRWVSCFSRRACYALAAQLEALFSPKSFIFGDVADETAGLLAPARFAGWCRFVGSVSQQGILRCWVDLMTPEDAKAFPQDDIALPPPRDFEVSVLGDWLRPPTYLSFLGGRVYRAFIVAT